MNEHLERPKVGIIILSWNRKDEIIACLDSVAVLNYPNFQVYVVDNHSSDGSLDYLSLEESGGRLILIKNSENFGYTGGNNLGMKAALGDDCDYLWLLNNDAVVEPSSLSYLVDYAETSPRLGLLSPLISFIDEPDSFTECGARINWSKQEMEIADSPEEAKRWLIESSNSFLLSGTALLVKRQTALDLEGLDERFFAYGEDRDYSLRAINLGYKAGIVSNARVFHSKSNHVRALHFYFYMCRNRYLFWAKHCPQSGMLIRTWEHLPFLAEMMNWSGKSLRIRQVIFEAFLEAHRSKSGKWMPASGLYLGITNCLAFISLAPFYAKRFLRKVDPWNLRNRIRPWKSRHMTAKDFLVTRTRNRVHFKRELNVPHGNGDVSVILPVMNRYNFRLANTLNSIRLQDYPANLINIVLVDYGSKNEFSKNYLEVCRRYNAEYLRIDGPSEWNLSHATNTAIKRVRTEYILCTGMDLMLSPGFIGEAVKRLRKRPKQLIVSTMFKAPEGLITEYLNLPDMESLREQSEIMHRPETWPHRMNPGVNIGLKQCYERIRGYDERFVERSRCRGRWCFWGSK
ncbi:MAG: glycosyltransferase family 2 protein, partial [Verrucomicrobia bacterium]|nr:glycosyltransferase family 2 protein [Verrucomicrobiota bacterium]